MAHSETVVVDTCSSSNVFGRDLSKARDAYERGNAEASRLAHQLPGQAKEEHSKSGEGASLSSVAIMVLGFANLVGDGISMGFGDFISSQAEREYARKEWGREKFELENYPEGEKMEMVQLYMAKGMTQEDAVQVIDTMSKYTNLFVDHMVVHELGLRVPDDEEQVWKNGLVTFASFCVFGLVPLLSYIGFHALRIQAAFDIEFFLACVLTAIALFSLGIYKSRFVSAHWWTSGLWVLTNGAVAAGAAYLIGWGLSSLFGDNGCNSG